jgi:hypothetical protein
MSINSVQNRLRQRELLVKCQLPGSQANFPGPRAFTEGLADAGVPRPLLRSARKARFVQIAGKQVSLRPDRDEAMCRFMS